MTALLRRLLVMLALLSPAAGQAAEFDAATYRRLNEAIVDGHIVPRYAALAAATAALDRATAALCAHPAAAAFAATRRAYVGGLDAWQAIQHVRFGPVEYFSRSSRFAFWPDPRNSVGRALDELLAGRDPAALAPEALMRANVAGQGFPALERLLFDEESERKLLSGGEEARHRCAVLAAIAANLATMAADIRREWIGGDHPYRGVIAAAGTPGTPYIHPREATLDLVKALHLAVELVADHKLARPLGASPQAARPRLAESWRSGRSLENIRIDLAAGEAMYGVAGGFSAVVRETVGDRALDDLLRRAFAQTLASARAARAPVEQGVADAKARPGLERLQREATALKTLIAERLTAALDIPLGFNALDGD